MAAIAEDKFYANCGLAVIPMLGKTKEVNFIKIWRQLFQVLMLMTTALWRSLQSAWRQTHSCAFLWFILVRKEGDSSVWVRLSWHAFCPVLFSNVVSFVCSNVVAKETWETAVNELHNHHHHPNRCQEGHHRLSPSIGVSIAFHWISYYSPKGKQSLVNRVQTCHRLSATIDAWSHGKSNKWTALGKQEKTASFALCKLERLVNVSWTV